MGAPRTLEIDEPFDEVDGELRHTEMFLTAYPVTAALAPPFAATRTEVRKQRAEEATLIDAILLSRALALAADDELNRLADDTKKAVTSAFKEEYQAPLYKQLFAGQSPSELKRPLLGAQLATMRNWIGPLGATGITELSAIATRLVSAVAKADEAETKMALAQQAMDAFKAGPRTTCINECNALRKLTYGKLSEIVHGNADVPSDFADRFYMTTGGSRAPTIAEMTQSVERLRAKLKRHETQLEAAKEKAAQQLRERQEAELAERKARFEAAQKRAAEAAAEVAKLQAELEAGGTQ
ncbi:MAG: hypothetical protein IPM54_11275 [Polyangiaceae bacterium]|nr:hypothetical protein [Polyangiaceae bacterium]